MTASLQEEILKAIELGDFVGGQGLLNRDQQREYVVLLKRMTAMFGVCRTIIMPQAAMEISKLQIGEPITVSVTENTNPAQDNKVLVNTVHLDAKKVRSSHDLTTEVLQQNLEGDDFEMTVIRAMAARSALDLGLLALLGDTTLPSGTKYNNLLNGQDGWYKRAQNGHVLDLQGAEIEPGIFSEMIRMLPQQYRGDPGLRFIVSETLVIDWQDTLQSRPTALGDSALGAFGPSLAPYGKKFQVEPLISDDMPITVSESVPAYIYGTIAGPFTIVTGTNDQLNFQINGGATVNVVLSTQNPDTGPFFGVGGNIDAVSVIAAINAAIALAYPGGVPAIAYDDGWGRVVLKTVGTGSAVNLTVLASSTAASTIGWALGETTGTDNTGIVREGSFIMLTNPKNLIWGILDGTRMFTQYNKDFDRIESVVYNQVATAIENYDAVVLATNLRRKRYVTNSLP
jgi:hypothetical protein